MRHRRGAMALMVPAHAGPEHGHALSEPWVSHHEGSETYGVTVGRPVTGRTSGRPIRTPPPAAPPLACGITLGRWWHGEAGDCHSQDQDVVVEHGGAVAGPVGGVGNVESDGQREHRFWPGGQRHRIPAELYQPRPRVPAGAACSAAMIPCTAKGSSPQPSSRHTGACARLTGLTLTGEAGETFGLIPLRESGR